MEKNTVIIYSTVDGQTLKICGYLSKILNEKDRETHLFHIDFFSGELEEYGKIIIASSIRYGKHNEKIIKFIEENHEILNSKKAAFISVNLVARKPEKNNEITNPYVSKFLGGIFWKPSLVGVFAGMLDYSKYNFLDKLMIRLIMVITKGPIFPKSAIEYTDWKRVDAFAGDFLKL
ncbi:menaquinone-dependent protoporphyrinogen IX dehydrogenase [Aquiflexum lacus]|uniref:menaquinone-dependent protoporphyrinogen IX dehydrogenase n=1 Tax=Aquiflexum lacus TaxID=2483805 RepID=UPI0018950681|nr:menaquinone-dependent protoporphyrinogen IX dehydrogenase [Aquiflexum lacus]